MKNIFFIGFMGSGKSTVTQKLSEWFHAETVEMDALIEQQQNMKITEIFETFGEEYFRDLETKLLLDIKQKQGMLVSCGGGVVIRPQNVELMKQGGIVVLLSAAPQTIYERVRDSQDRPILNGNMNVEYIAKLQEKRRTLYEAAADYTIMTDGKDVDAICLEIQKIVENKS